MSRFEVSLRFFLLLMVAFVESPEARAQRRRQSGRELPQTVLHSVYPAGLRIGESIDLTIRGADLDGPLTIWCDDPNIKATHLNGLTYRVSANEQALIGHHDIRVSNRFGVSNPRVFVVGHRPESSEQEPNSVLGQANSIDWNSIKNGEIGTPADVDYFQFKGTQGKRLYIEVEAERIDSQLDPTLHLIDFQGREIAESRDREGLDSVIETTLPTDGTYFIKVHDATFQGSPNHGYRLLLSDGPRVEAVSPPLVHSLEPRSHTVFGWNLGGTPSPFVVEGFAVEQLSVSLPGSNRTAKAFPAYADSLLNRSSTADRDGFEWMMDAPNGRSNPTFLSWVEDPILLEAEAEFDGQATRLVQISSVISGAFEIPNDLDRYRFTVKKGETLSIGVGAEEIGSQAHPVVQIHQVLADGNLKELLTISETRDRGAGLRFGTETVNGAALWNAPEDGTYEIQISDLFGSQRSDIRLGYRLNLHPPRPDFSLVTLPESPNQPDALVVARGGRSIAYVLALRADGFDGPILVSIVNPPSWLKMVPVVIASNQSVAPIVLEAASDAPSEVSTITLRGESRFEDQKRSLSYTSGLTQLTVDRRHLAKAGVVVWPGGNPGDNNQKGAAPARLTNGFVVQAAELPHLGLKSSLTSIRTTPGGLLSIPLEVERPTGFDDAVTLSSVNTFPNTKPPAPITVSKPEPRGIIHQIVPKETRAGLYSLVFQGTGSIRFSTDPKAEKKANVVLHAPSNPIQVLVRPSPIKLTLEKPGSVKPGGDLTVIVKAEGLPGRFPLSLVAPESLRLSAAPSVFDTSQPFKLMIKAAADSPPGAALGVGLKIMIPSGNETIEVIEPLPLTINK